MSTDQAVKDQAGTEVSNGAPSDTAIIDKAQSFRERMIVNQLRATGMTLEAFQATTADFQALVLAALAKAQPLEMPRRNSLTANGKAKRPGLVIPIHGKGTGTYVNIAGSSALKIILDNADTLREWWTANAPEMEALQAEYVEYRKTRYGKGADDAIDSDDDAVAGSVRTSIS